MVFLHNINHREDNFYSLLFFIFDTSIGNPSLKIYIIDAEHERLGKAIEFIQESLRKINSNIDKGFFFFLFFWLSGTLKIIIIIICFLEKKIDEMKLCSKLNEVENALEGFTPYIKEALDSEFSFSFLSFSFSLLLTLFV